MYSAHRRGEESVAMDAVFVLKALASLFVVCFCGLQLALSAAVADRYPPILSIQTLEQ